MFCSDTNRHLSQSENAGLPLRKKDKVNTLNTHTYYIVYIVYTQVLAMDIYSMLYDGTQCDRKAKIQKTVGSVNQD